jgi:hypothetical protein
MTTTKMDDRIERLTARIAEYEAAAARYRTYGATEAVEEMQAMIDATRRLLALEKAGK